MFSPTRDQLVAARFHLDDQADEDGQTYRDHRDTTIRYLRKNESDMGGGAVSLAPYEAKWEAEKIALFKAMLYDAGVRFDGDSCMYFAATQEWLSLIDAGEIRPTTHRGYAAVLTGPDETFDNIVGHVLYYQQLTFKGRTGREAIAAFEAVVDDYLAQVINLKELPPHYWPQCEFGPEALAAMRTVVEEKLETWSKAEQKEALRMLAVLENQERMK